MDTEENMEESSYLPYFVVSRNVVQEVNYAFLDLTGYVKENLVDRTFWELCSLLRLDSNIVSNSFAEKKDYFLFTYSHEVREVEIFIRQGIGRQERVYFVREVPNSRLEYRFPMIQQLYLHNTFGVAIFSVSDTTLLKANQFFLDSLNEPFNHQEISAGKRISEIVTNWKESPYEIMWNDTITNNCINRAEAYECVHPIRGITYWDKCLTPILEGERIKYIVEISQDVTEKVLDKKRLEQEIDIIMQQNRQLERALKMKEEFFSFMSHEFKTPLTIINTAVQAIQTLCKDELSKKASVFVKKIHQNSLRQIRILNNLLDITRSDEGYTKINMKNADIITMTKAIVESVSFYAAQKGIRLNFFSDLLVQVIAIDDEKYERILLNLLSNAIKFTPQGKAIYVNISTKLDCICIEVRDEGIGIPKEKLGIIFDRFGQVSNSLTRNCEGTGIGLSLVKILVNALNGKIGVQSEEGVGTTFEILLPISVANEDQAQLELEGIPDQHLIRAVDIEFSDIYTS